MCSAWTHWVIDPLPPVLDGEGSRETKQTKMGSRREMGLLGVTSLLNRANTGETIY